MVSPWLTPNSRPPPARVSGPEMPPGLWRLPCSCCPERLVHAPSPATSASSEGKRGTGARSLQRERWAPLRGRAGESSTWPPPWPPGPQSWAWRSGPALADESSGQRRARTPRRGTEAPRQAREPLPGQTRREQRLVLPAVTLTPAWHLDLAPESYPGRWGPGRENAMGSPWASGRQLGRSQGQKPGEGLQGPSSQGSQTPGRQVSHRTSAGAPAHL